METCDALELAEWEALYLVSPWGDEWRQTARIATSICTAFGAKDLKEEMLMPSFRKRPQTTEEMMAMLVATGMFKKVE